MFVFEGVENFRDVGGLPTSDGLRVRGGALFRSASLDRITANDARVLSQLGVRVVCDLRKPTEARKSGSQNLRPATSATGERARNRQPEPGKNDRLTRLGRRFSLSRAGFEICSKAAEARVQLGGARRVNVPLHWQDSRDSRRQLRSLLFSADGEQRYERYISEYYRHVAFDAAPRIGEVVRLLADPAGSPMVVYCSAGKDRTSIVIAVILMLLGVSFERVVEDYLQTNRSYAREVARLVRWVPIVSLFRVPKSRVELVVGTHARFLRAVFDEVLHHHGDIENYAINACRVDAETLTALRRQMLGSK